MRAIKGVILGGVCFYLLACGLAPKWCQKPFPEINVPVKEQNISSEEYIQQNLYGDYLASYFARKNQEYDKTIIYLKRVLEKDPDNAEFKKDLYLFQALQGRFDDMIPLVQEIAQTENPKFLAEYILIAKEMKDKQYQQAQKLLADKRKYDLDPILKPVFESWIYAGLNQREKADQALQALQKEKGGKALYLYYHAVLSHYFKDEKQVEADLTALAQEGYPSLLSLLFVRDLYTGTDKWQDGKIIYDQYKLSKLLQNAAKDVFERIQFPKELTPELGAALSFYDLSVIIAPTGAIETSLLFNAISLYLEPSLTIPKIWSAELFESLEAYQAANRMYERIEKPLDIILFKKARNLMLTNEYRQALPLLQDIVARNPDNELMLRFLGDAYNREGKEAESLNTYLKLVNLLKQKNQKADLGIAFFEIGAVYDKIGNYAQAELYLKQALELLPNHPLILNYLGYLWLERNQNIEEAFQMIQKAHKILPEDAHIMDSMALAHYRMKEYDKALPLAERSIDLIPFSSVAYGHLGDIYAAMGRDVEALYQYERALTLTVDMTPDLKESLKRKIRDLKSK